MGCVGTSQVPDVHGVVGRLWPVRFSASRPGSKHPDWVASVACQRVLLLGLVLGGACGPGASGST